MTFRLFSIGDMHSPEYVCTTGNPFFLSDEWVGFVIYLTGEARCHSVSCLFAALEMGLPIGTLRYVSLGFTFFNGCG